MDAYTVAFVSLLVLCGAGGQMESWLNVGSVLFARRDLYKPMDNTRLAVLEARRHFQALVPPPDLAVTDHNYVENTMSYFRDVYVCIKNESPDPEVDKILTTALSDVVGGYIKMYMLPFTKVFFYGGVVSFDDAARVFNFFNEVKKYLNTNGTGWRQPNLTILNTITITTTRLPRDKSKCTKYSCNDFSYLERTEDGLEIPLPTINWDEETMFMPYKNESTFTLTSPKHSNVLNSYYDNVGCCLQTMSTEDEIKFNEKFQNWLAREVVPHLYRSNDCLYVALGNVLSLVNKTRAMCESILVYCKKNNKNDAIPKLQEPSSEEKLSSVQNLFKSKTLIIVTAMLLLEIIWCMCVFKHIIYKKSGKDIERNGSNKEKIKIRDHGTNSNTPRTKTISTESSMGSWANKSKSNPCNECTEPCKACPVRLRQVEQTGKDYSVNAHLHDTASFPNVISEETKYEYGGVDDSIDTGTSGKYPRTTSASVICETKWPIKYTVESPTSPKPSFNTDQEDTLVYDIAETKAAGEKITDVTTEDATNHVELTQKPITETYNTAGYSSSHKIRISSERTVVKKDSFKHACDSADILNLNTSVVTAAETGCDTECPCISCLQEQVGSVCVCEKHSINSVNNAIEATKAQKFVCDDSTEKQTFLITNKGSRKYLEIQIEKNKNAEINFGIVGKGIEQTMNKSGTSRIPKKTRKGKEEITYTTRINQQLLEQTTETSIQMRESAISGTGIILTDDVTTQSESLKGLTNPMKHKPRPSTYTKDEHKDQSPDLPRKPGILKHRKKHAKIKEPGEVTRTPKVYVVNKDDIHKTSAVEDTEKSPDVSLQSKKKTCIPKLRTPIADDTVIDSKEKDSKKDDRLNITM